MLACVEIESAPRPASAVIWLHGLGADGHDFASLVPQLDLRACPPIRFVFPHAPSIPVTLNGGYVMPAWYDIRGADLLSAQDVQGIKNSEQAIVALIEHEISLGIAAKNIVLAGFSQGSAMALHTGLRFGQRLAGLLGLSGYLPLAETFAIERSAANAHTPIFMGHGSLDPVVIPQRGERTRDFLVSLGYPVHWHSYPMAHAVHPREIADIAVFLANVLSTANASV